jgi:hypothetical protein
MHQSRVKNHGSNGWQMMYGRTIVGDDPTGLVVVDWMVAKRKRGGSASAQRGLKVEGTRWFKTL